MQNVFLKNVYEQWDPCKTNFIIMKILWITTLDYNNWIPDNNIEFVIIVWIYKDKVLMLLNNEEWRWWEFPWGKVEKDELLLDAANREFYEEVWFKSPYLIYVWTYINKYANSTAQSKCHLYTYYVNNDFIYSKFDLEVFSFLPNNTSLDKSINLQVISDVNKYLNGLKK